MKLLKTREVAAITGVPESTLRYWRCAGLGPCWVKLQGRVRYDEADVDAYVKANKRIPSVRAAMEGDRYGRLSA
ncbi:MAG: helix-turn-helix transcriptional regulator [Acidobacteriaceae bacterium]